MPQQPTITVNGYCINDGVTHRLSYRQCSGLFEPAHDEAGVPIQTYEGKAVQYPGYQDFASRKITIVGTIINQASYNAKQKALSDLSAIFSGHPSKLKIGSLVLEVEWGAVQIVDDARKNLPSTVTYKVEGEAVPATYLSEVPYQTGRTQGVLLNDYVAQSASYVFSGNSFAYTNGGTAPTEAVISLSGLSASTTVYLKGADGRRVPVTSDTNGTGYANWGLILLPGANAIRIENADGTLYTATTPKTSFYGTQWRYLGEPDTRFMDGPIYALHRTGSASHITMAGAFATAGDGVPRITANGLLLEGAGTNRYTYPESFANAYWTKEATAISATAIPAPTGSGTMELMADNTTATGGFDLYKGSTATAGSNTVSVFGKAKERSILYIMENSTGTLKLTYFNLATGTVGTTAAGHTAKIESVGNGVFRCSITFTGTTNGLTGFGMAKVDGQNSYVGVVGEGLYIWGACSLPDPFITSYTAATRNADQCAVVEPCNELTYSHDLTKSAWTKLATATVSKSGNDNTVTFAASGDNLYQLYSPSDVVGTPRTLAITLKLGTLSGSVKLRLDKQDGTAVLVEKTINTSDLSATDYKTFFVTTTPGTGVTGLRARLVQVSGTGTIIVGHMRLLPGSHPGVEVIPQDIPILSSGITQDPAFWQNGAVEFDAVLMGPNTTILGGQITTTNAWVIRCDTTKVYFDYADTVSASYIRVGVTVPSLAAGTKIHIKAGWRNYSAGGKQRLLTLTVDSASATSAIQTSGDWKAPERLWLSMGSAGQAPVNATLSNVIPSYNPIPAGATL